MPLLPTSPYESEPPLNAHDGVEGSYARTAFSTLSASLVWLKYLPHTYASSWPVESHENSDPYGSGLSPNDLQWYTTPVVVLGLPLQGLVPSLAVVQFVHLHAWKGELSECGHAALE